MRSASITRHVIETIPLPVFLVYSRMIDEPTVPENWLGPYLSSTILALCSTSILLWQKVSLNRCFIGINLYFVVGTAGLLAEQTWLNQLLGVLEASAMLMCIVLVGAISSFFGSSGFVGVTIPDKKRLRMFSLLLLFIAIIATAISYIFRENTLLSEFLPFIALFTCMNFFKSYLNRNQMPLNQQETKVKNYGLDKVTSR